MSAMQKKISRMKRIVWFCRMVVAGSTGISIWGNALHANWADGISIAICVLPPFFMFLGFELTTRAPLRTDVHWFRKWPRPIATVGITAANGWLSYWHQRDAFVLHTDFQTASILPVLIDLTMIVALVTLIDMNERLRQLESTLAAEDVVINQPAGEGAQPVRARRTRSKTARVVRALNDHPELSVKDLAKKLQVSESLVSTVRRDQLAKQAA